MPQRNGLRGEIGRDVAQRPGRRQRAGSVRVTANTISSSVLLNVVEMSNRVQHVLTFIAMTGVAFFVFLLLLPNLKMGRNEARTIQTYNEVHRLRDEYTGTIPRSRIELDENDIWGNPYIVEPTEDGRVRIRSTGMNGQFEPNGDDIWSDMPTSPMQPFRTRRTWEWVRAIGAGIAVWGFFVWGHWRSVRTEGN